MTSDEQRKADIETLAVLSGNIFAVEWKAAQVVEARSMRALAALRKP